LGFKKKIGKGKGIRDWSVKNLLIGLLGAIRHCRLGSRDTTPSAGLRCKLPAYRWQSTLSTQPREHSREMLGRMDNAR